METSVTDWLRTGAAALRDPRRMRDLAGDVSYRIEQKLVRRYSDVQLRQLRSLRRAYAAAVGPELLVFGDSTMFWTAPTDDDPRQLVTMIRDELGGEITHESIVGPLYNTRITRAFIGALAHSRSRPKVIMLGISALMSQGIWLASPSRGYERESAQLNAIIAANRRRLPRRLSGGETAEDLLAWDRLPAPSLFGARRTVGELRLITSSRPTTPWQVAVRMRHMLDFYNAERLEPDSLGIRLVAELGETIRRLEIPAVAYIAPVNFEVLESLIGPHACEVAAHNVDLIVETFTAAGGGFGHTVDASAGYPADTFMDPLHLTADGRRRFAVDLAAGIAPFV